MNDHIQNVRPQHFVRPEDAGVSTLNNAAEYLAKEIGTIVGKESLREVGKKPSTEQAQAQGGLALQQPADNATEPSNINPLIFSMVAVALTMKTTKESQEGQFSVLDTDQAAYAAKCKDQIDQIQDSIDQANKSKKAGTWGNIFGWVATIAIDVVAIAATVLTGGAALPLLVGAVIATTLKVGSEFGSPGLTALTNLVAKGLEAMGVSDNTAQLIAGIVVAVAVVVVSIVACAGTGLAADSIVTLGEKGLKKLTGAAVKLSWNLLSDASSTVGKVAFGLKVAGGVTSGVATVGTGASDIASSTFDYKSAMAEIEAKGSQAVLNALNELMDQLLDKISMIFQLEAALVSGLAANISGAGQTVGMVARNTAV